MSESTQSQIHGHRTWKLWDRGGGPPPPFRPQERDLRIVEAVFQHRFLQPHHLHALLGGSAVNLARRCRMLWRHRYLERPRALRPTTILTEEITYGLGPEGARYLERSYPKLRGIGELDWAESPSNPVGWPYIDHQLGAVNFLVPLKLACARRGIEFRLGGHFKRPRLKAPGYKHGLIPDAYFVLRDPDRGEAAHFLELERAGKKRHRPLEKYKKYLAWWKDQQRKGSFPYKGVRVLTVAWDSTHEALLRRIAAPIGRDGRHPHTWKGFLFTNLSRFSLEDPESVLAPIFRYADEEDPIALV